MCGYLREMNNIQDWKKEWTRSSLKAADLEKSVQDGIDSVVIKRKEVERVRIKTAKEKT